MSEEETTVRITLAGGPTVLLELGGLRLLTDPTFDPAGTEYPTAVYTLLKTTDPAIPASDQVALDAVLLSHDHHFDNLDHAGRQLLRSAGRVLTTIDGAERLGGAAVGLAPGDHQSLIGAGGRSLKITAAPARHGPAAGDRGPVIGFVLEWADAPEHALYITGDTVWYEGVAETLKRYPINSAIVFAGAARVKEVGPDALTFTSEDLLQFTQAAPKVLLIPIHIEGWRHFSESSEDVANRFSTLGLGERLIWLKPGVSTAIPF